MALSWVGCQQELGELIENGELSAFMSQGRVPGLLTEAGDLYPHALQEAGKLGSSFELGYRVELLERRREGVREAPQCARFEL